MARSGTDQAPVVLKMPLIAARLSRLGGKVNTRFVRRMCIRAEAVWKDGDDYVTDMPLLREKLPRIWHLLSVERAISDNDGYPAE
jgi:hypothetical protein